MFRFLSPQKASKAKAQPFWPNNSEASMLACITRAASMSLLQAAVTMAAIVADAYGVWHLGFDWGNLLDVGLCIILAVYLYRASRVAAVLSVLYQGLNIYYMVAGDYGKDGMHPGLLTFVILAVYVAAVKATFAYQKLLSGRKTTSLAA